MVHTDPPFQPTPTPAPNPTSAPTPTPRPSEIDGWRLVAPPASSFFPVTGAHGRFVGFGTQPYCDDDVELCPVSDAFYSDDGISWSIAASNDAFTDEQGRAIKMTAVTPYAGGFVATGSIIDRATEVVEGGVWVSDDGTAWSMVNMPPIDLGVTHGICQGVGYVFGRLGFAVVGSRLLARGFRDGPRNCDPNREIFALQSGDGETWEPAALPDLGSGGSFTGLQGGRQFVLTSAGTGRTAIWTSPDGSEWAIGSMDLPRGGYLRKIVETSDGYLAFVSRDRATPYSQIVLASADGLRWEQIANEQLPPDWQPLVDAVLVGNTIVAIGGFGHDTDPNNYQGTLYGITQTTNGMTWSTPETAAFAGYSISSLTTDGTSVLVTGQSYSDLDYVHFVKSSW
jgi:hypothetical protein